MRFASRAEAVTRERASNAYGSGEARLTLARSAVTRERPQARI